MITSSFGVHTLIFNPSDSPRMASATTVPLLSPQEATLSPSPLPLLLQTPSGLAMLELQGSINLPISTTPDTQSFTPIGRLEFPDYRASDVHDLSGTKRVYMYIGQHQRLVGEVKKLPRAIAVVGRPRLQEDASGVSMDVDMEDRNVKELEILEIVKYKLVFSQRPEPVGTT